MDDKVQEYHNNNISSIKTPIDVDALEKLLNSTNYDRKMTEFIRSGFKSGFSMGYKGPMERQDSANNIPLRGGNKTQLWNKIMKEVKLGRYTGPFQQPLFKYFVQSPIGLVPKDTGKKTRLIFHLSYNFGPDINQKSINFHIPDELCTVKYRDLDHAIKNSLRIVNSMVSKKLIYYSTRSPGALCRAVFCF